MKILPARFFRTAAGDEPVRRFLKDLDEEERRILGRDILDVEISWPIGMPLCRALKGYKGLWEVRSSLPGGRIARVLFCIRDEHMLLLHGFVKKDQKTPQKELDLAVKRMKEYDHDQ
jgi:phage-related protein